MPFGVLENDIILVISAVLSLIVMLLFWRVKKNSLQIAQNAGGFKTLMHLPYRQMRRSVKGKFGVYKLFLIILFILFTAVAFFWLHMKFGPLAAGIFCLPCAALTAVLFSELIWHCQRPEAFGLCTRQTRSAR